MKREAAARSSAKTYSHEHDSYFITL